MKIKKMQKTVISALFAAIICIATIIIQIPSPQTNGFLNLGDCFVIIAGWYLGAIYGALAAGIGSALADIIVGYGHYAPASFLIKAAMAAVACLILKAIGSKKITAKIVSSVVSEIIMIMGYFCYAALILGNGIAASAGIPGDVMQGTVGIIAAIAVSIAADKTKLNKYLE